MRPDVYQEVTRRIKIKLGNVVLRWCHESDKMYQRYLALMLGKAIPLEEAAMLRRNNVGLGEIYEFCDRFLLRGYDKTLSSGTNPPKRLPRPRWTSLRDATDFWVSCTHVGHIQSYAKGEIEVTCE